MRKVKIWYLIILFLLYMMICFSMPTLIVGNLEKESLKNMDIKDDEILSGDAFIKLLLTEENKVVTLSFEDYLKGVLIGEMPVTYELEALKAQAVVARTYTIYKMKNATTNHENEAHMCDDINCCQAYKTKDYALKSWDDEVENAKWEKIEIAVNSTSGEIIVYSGEVINAFFHAHSGGKTENVKYLWSKTEIPYLVSVEGNENSTRQDSKSFSKEEFKNLIKDLVPNFSGDSKILINDYTGSGRVNTLNIDGIEIEGTTLRALTGIKSTNFRIEDNKDTIIFYTVGYGHGVGMSQDGANQMAMSGSDYREIIKHYYTGVEISRITL